jgi:hypothetical protein
MIQGELSHRPRVLFLGAIGELDIAYGVHAFYLVNVEARRMLNLPYPSIWVLFAALRREYSIAGGPISVSKVVLLKPIMKLLNFGILHMLDQDARILLR